MRCFEVTSFLTWVINYKVAMRMFSRVKNLKLLSSMTSKGSQVVLFILFFKYSNESSFPGRKFVDKPKPWRTSLALELAYEGWTLIPKTVIY